MDELATPRRRPESQSLSEAQWQSLLDALGPDHERAAYEYETLRGGLIRIFRARGLWILAEDLADRTIDVSARRMLEKASTPQPVRDIRAYAQTVAKKIASELLRRPSDLPLDETRDTVSVSLPSDRNDAPMDEHTLDVLQRLIRELPDRDQAIISDYYRHSKSAKIENRARLARESARSSGALRVKVYRIRGLLAKRLREILDVEQRDARTAATSGGNHEFQV